MRPTGIESIRAAQAALAEVIAPELSSAFAQDAAQTLQMLLESLAGEWDKAAEWLRRDNERLAALLSASRTAALDTPRRNETLLTIVREIEAALRGNEDTSVVLSSLTSRNNALRATLELSLIAFEDVTGPSGSEEIDAVRREIYAHLKEVATRGWSFWDVSSFRGRMAALRSTGAGDDSGPSLG